MDNSIRIYEQIINKNNKSDLKYNIYTDSFVSCIYKKDKNSFFSGHKNGKLYEWKIIYTDNNDNKNSKLKSINSLSSIKTVELERDIIAHKESMICSINYIEKHQIIITTSMDGKLYIRKYFDFELLSIIKSKYENSIISKVIYTDYDLLYLLISIKDSKYNSRINIYTLNGLLIESSLPNNFIDIEPLKNGKIICNNLYSNSLKIFGFNKIIGSLGEETILENIPNSEVRGHKIISFIFQHNITYFYILLDNGILYKKYDDKFRLLSRGVDKLENNNSNKIYKTKP